MIEDRHRSRVRQPSVRERMFSERTLLLVCLPCQMLTQIPSNVIASVERPKRVVAVLQVERSLVHSAKPKP